MNCEGCNLREHLNTLSDEDLRGCMGFHWERMQAETISGDGLRYKINSKLRYILRMEEFRRMGLSAVSPSHAWGESTNIDVLNTLRLMEVEELKNE